MRLSDICARCWHAVLFAVIVSGCAHGGVWKNPGVLPEGTTVLAVAGLKQIDNRCGPNALTMMLNASGDPISEAIVAAAILNDRVDATLSLDLLLFARQRGFPADFERGDIDVLLMTLSSGKPVILLLNLELGVPWPLRGRPLWHYVVAYGFSRQEGFLLVHSGVGPKKVSFPRLNAMWKPGGFWMMHLGTPLDVVRTGARCP